MAVTMFISYTGFVIKEKLMYLVVYVRSGSLFGCGSSNVLHVFKFQPNSKIYDESCLVAVSPYVEKYFKKNHLCFTCRLPQSGLGRPMSPNVSGLKQPQVRGTSPQRSSNLPTPRRSIPRPVTPRSGLPTPKR